MLTKNDLQQIKNIFRDEFTVAIDQQIRPMVKNEIGKALKPIKRKLDKLHKDFHAFVDYFDGRLTKVERDVKDLKQN